MCTSTLKKQIESIINEHEGNGKSYYFWSPPSNAFSRRAKEYETKVEFELKGKKYEVSQKLECSCKNYYYSLSITVDGSKKDVRALKKALKDCN